MSLNLLLLKLEQVLNKKQREKFREFSQKYKIGHFNKLRKMGPDYSWRKLIKIYQLARHPDMLIVMLLLKLSMIQLHKFLLEVIAVQLIIFQVVMFPYNQTQVIQRVKLIRFKISHQICLKFQIHLINRAQRVYHHNLFNLCKIFSHHQCSQCNHLPTICKIKYPQIQ